MAEQLRRLRDPDPAIRENAAEALGYLRMIPGARERVPLPRRLGDPDPAVRENAVWALGTMGPASATPEVLNELIRLLDDNVPVVREKAVWSLGMMGPAAATPEVLNELIRLLDDNVPVVREKAVWALSMMGPAAVTPEVLAKLLRLSDDECVLQEHVTLALDRLGPVTLTALLRLLDDPDPVVRGRAAQALGQLGPEEATPEVLVRLGRRLADDEHMICEYAAQALDGLRTAVERPEVLAGLILLLASGDSRVSGDAARALGRIKGNKYVEESLKKIQSERIKEDKRKIRELGSVPSPEETIKKLVAELIPTLPPAAEEKAESIIALNHTINQTYWQELRGVAEPLIKSLLEDIPAGYEGKRRRATLINALLTALDRGILIHDENGQRHVCSLQATHGRESDRSGALRLLERTVKGSTRKSYAIPSLDQVHIIDTPGQERHDQAEPVRNTRTI